MLNDGKHTAAPWCWRLFGKDRIALSTPNRGALIVMDFISGHTTRSIAAAAVRPADRHLGGVMRRAGELDLAEHPDARLIEAAPAMYEALLQTLMMLSNVNTVEPFAVVSRILAALSQAGYPAESLADARDGIACGAASLLSGHLVDARGGQS